MCMCHVNDKPFRKCKGNCKDQNESELSASNDCLPINCETRTHAHSVTAQNVKSEPRINWLSVTI